MIFIRNIRKRYNQRKAKRFIKHLKNASDSEVKQLYLDSKQFHENEIVLSHLFFNYTSLISILPLEFQKKMINSNLPMFNYGSDEAKKSLVSDWFKNNKFFINYASINISNMDYEKYLCMYFNQPEDVVKLYMQDLYNVILVLSKNDLRMTEELINYIKDKLSERQWEFILKVNPIFVKYASQDIQKKYADDENYGIYINGEARDIYIHKQLDKIKENSDLLNDMTIDIQREYLILNPYIINKLSDQMVTNLLKYDIELVKYLNLPSLKNKSILYDILENATNKSNDEIINIFVDKCLLNAKGKLYRFDWNSNNLTYQYTKRMIRIIQNLSFEQIIHLINIDVNYVLPYIVPLYNEDENIEYKKSETLEANSKCLNLFKKYYGDELYSKYYKIINKIYNEYIYNIEKYDYFKDYDCIFELFKIIFNRKIILNNNVDRINLFIGISLLYKGKDNDESKKALVKLLNEILSNAYKKQVDLKCGIYELSSLEIFDDNLSYLDENLLLDLSKYNFSNMTTLLYISKNNKNRILFKTFHEILSSVYKNGKETLLVNVENFTYYRDILEDIKDKELTDKEIDNFIRLIVSNKNYLNITKKDELKNYDIKLIKKLSRDLVENKDEEKLRNIVCNFLFNKYYDNNGNNLWIESSNVKEWCDVCSFDTIEELEKNGSKVFTDDEQKLFTMIKLLFSTNDVELLLTFITDLTNELENINIVAIINLFNRLKENMYDIINYQIVTIDDIEQLNIVEPGSLLKKEENGVIIYTILDKDFRILTSYSNDGYHYDFSLMSEIDRNCFGYNKLIKNGSVRFGIYDNKTMIKLNKDRKVPNKMEPDFIIVVGEVTPDVLNIARERNIKILCKG